MSRPDVTLTDRKYQFTTRGLVRAYPQHFQFGASEYELIVRGGEPFGQNLPGARAATHFAAGFRVHQRDLHYIMQPVGDRERADPRRLARRRELFEREAVPSIISGAGNLLPAGVVPLVVLRDLRDAALRREFNSLAYSDLFDLYLFGMPGSYETLPPEEAAGQDKESADEEPTPGGDA